MENLKQKAYYSTLLVSIVVVLSSVLLFVVKGVTDEEYAIRDAERRLAAYRVFFAEGTLDDSVEFSGNDEITDIIEVKNGDTVIGVIYNVKTVGAPAAGNNPIEYILAIDKVAGEFVGISIASHSETSGFGAKIVEAPFLDSFKNITFDSSYEVPIDVLAGATQTWKSMDDSVAGIVGHYLVTYAGVTDPNPPVFAGADDVTIAAGDSFDPLAGVTATDDTDGDVTANINVTGDVDATTVGEYTLTYTVSDAAGNQATAQRVVTVEPSIPAEASTLFPTAASFEDVTGEFNTGDFNEIKGLYRALDSNGATIGFVYKVRTIGAEFAGENPITYYMGVDPQTNTFTGFEVGSHSETDGYGAKIEDDPYNSQFDGAAIDTGLVIDAIAGATQTSVAMDTSIKDTIIAHYKANLEGINLSPTWMSELYPNAVGFVDASGSFDLSNHSEIVEIYEAVDGSSNVIGYLYVVQTVGSTDAGSNNITYAVTIDATTDLFVDFVVRSQNETDGLGAVIKDDPFEDQFAGNAVEGAFEIDAMAGATQTWTSMNDSVKNTVIDHYLTVVKGGN